MDKHKKQIEIINKMGKLDQELRIQKKIDWKKVNRAAKKHTEKLKEIIEEIGFPGVSKIGKEANRYAWLIVQHSPELDFMKNYLKMMEEQEESEYDKQHWAYLTDRILMYEGKPQVYGTQMKMNDKGEYELWEVEDRENLNNRRKELGMGTIEDYLESY